MVLPDVGAAWVGRIPLQQGGSEIGQFFAVMANCGVVEVDLGAVLGDVGRRLRELRRGRGLTLAQLAAITDISVSTLSRLEGGQRRPSLELLLPLALAYQLPLDELVGAPAIGDPRIHPRPVRHDGATWVPLHRDAGGVNAYKQILPVERTANRTVAQRSHEGYEWLYVLVGQLGLALGPTTFHLDAGEAAEFDTRTPHAVTNSGAVPAELLIIYGQQGQRVHMHSPREP